MVRNVKTKATGDLESRVTILEARVAVLEQSSKKVMRKKRAYTDNKGLP
jgi:chaperonin cofactor prefoldin